MGGEHPRNGGTPGGRTPDSAPEPGARWGVLGRVRRRVRDELEALIAAGALPGDLDFDRFTVAPPRWGGHGDAVVDAGLVFAREYARSAAADGLGLSSALADKLRAAPEFAAVALVGAGLVVVTLRPAVFFDGVRAVLCDGPDRFEAPTMPGGDAPVGAPSSGAPSDPEGAAVGGASLAELRATVVAEMRAAMAAAAGRSGAPSRRGAAAPMPLAPVVLRGGPSAADPAGPDRGRPGAPARDRVPARVVLSRVGEDGFRFAAASCRAEAALHLDLDLLGSRSSENALFWIRYAHARVHAALRRIAETAPEIGLRPAELAASDFARLTAEADVALARLIAQDADVVATGCPRRLVRHLACVADAVHFQWNRSKEQPQSRFVNEELREMAVARLGLMAAGALLLRSGLRLLGIAAPDEMR